MHHVFDTYRSCITFMKGMNLTLESWRPHWYPEGYKQDPDVLGSDLSEENLGGEYEEDLGKITGTPNKGEATEKG